MADLGTMALSNGTSSAMDEEPLDTMMDEDGSEIIITLNTDIDDDDEEEYMDTNDKPAAPVMNGIIVKEQNEKLDEIIANMKLKKANSVSDDKQKDTESNKGAEKDKILTNGSEKTEDECSVGKNNANEKVNNDKLSVAEGKDSETADTTKSEDTANVTDNDTKVRETPPKSTALPSIVDACSLPSVSATTSLLAVSSATSLLTVSSATSVLSVSSATSVLSVSSATSVLSVSSATSMLSVSSATSLLAVSSATSMLAVSSATSMLSVSGATSMLNVSSAAPSLQSTTTSTVSSLVKSHLTTIIASTTAAPRHKSMPPLTSAASHKITNAPLIPLQSKEQLVSVFNTKKPDPESLKQKAMSSWEQLDEIKKEAAVPTSVKAKNMVIQTPKYSKTEADMAPLAKFLFDIGLDIVKENAYRDLIHIQERKLHAGKLNEKEVEQVDKLKTYQSDLKKKNDHLKIPVRKCKICRFMTESLNVMFWHHEHPHILERDLLSCCYCSFSTRLPSAFTFHMESEHLMAGRMPVKSPNFQCSQCPYEHNARMRFITQHKTRCDKLFDLNKNLLPDNFAHVNICLRDCFHVGQIEALAQQKAQQWAKQARMKQQTTSFRAIPSNQTGVTLVPINLGNGVVTYVTSVQYQSIVGGNLATLGSSGVKTVQQILGSNRPTLLSNVQQRPRFGTMQRMATPSPPRLTTPPPLRMPAPKLVSPPHFPTKMKPTRPPPVQRAPRPKATPVQAPPFPQAKTQTKQSNFEVCEICGGFVKDRVALRIHFFYAHQVEIPVALFSRTTPPLACEMCRMRCWTTQGLMKHKENFKHFVSRTQVTRAPTVASMINKQPMTFSKPIHTPAITSVVSAKPSTTTAPMSSDPSEVFYPCIICGLNTSELVNHMTTVHSLCLNDFLAQRRCMVCGKMGSSRADTEVHMAAAHAVLPVTKNMAKTTTRIPTSPMVNVARSQTPAKQPQPSSSSILVKTPPEGSSKSDLVKASYCTFCGLSFNGNAELTRHCLMMHKMCKSCGIVLVDAKALAKHYCGMSTKKSCELCHVRLDNKESYQKHVEEYHLKTCKIPLKRVSDWVVESWNKKRRVGGNHVLIVADDDSDKITTSEKAPSETKSDVDLTDLTKDDEHSSAAHSTVDDTDIAFPMDDEADNDEEKMDDSPDVKESNETLEENRAKPVEVANDTDDDKGTDGENNNKRSEGENDDGKMADAISDCMNNHADSDDKIDDADTGDKIEDSNSGDMIENADSGDMIEDSNSGDMIEDADTGDKIEEGDSGDKIDDADSENDADIEHRAGPPEPTDAASKNKTKNDSFGEKNDEKSLGGKESFDDSSSAEEMVLG